MFNFWLETSSSSSSYSSPSSKEAEEALANITPSKLVSSSSSYSSPSSKATEVALADIASSKLVIFDPPPHTTTISSSSDSPNNSSEFKPDHLSGEIKRMVERRILLKLNSMNNQAQDTADRLKHATESLSTEGP